MKVWKWYNYNEISLLWKKCRQFVNIYLTGDFVIPDIGGFKGGSRGKGAMPPNSTPTCQKVVPYSVRIANNNTEIPANIWPTSVKSDFFGCFKHKEGLAAGLRSPADPHTLGDQSFLAACFCVRYSIVYFLLRIHTTEIISEACCCIIFGQSCMFCIMSRRKMWWPWKELENVTEYYAYICRIGIYEKFGFKNSTNVLGSRTLPGPTRVSYNVDRICILEKVIKMLQGRFGTWVKL